MSKQADHEIIDLLTKIRNAAGTPVVGPVLNNISGINAPTGGELAIYPFHLFLHGPNVTVGAKGTDPSGTNLYFYQNCIYPGSTIDLTSERPPAPTIFGMWIAHVDNSPADTLMSSLSAPIHEFHRISGAVGAVTPVALNAVLGTIQWTGSIEQINTYRQYAARIIGTAVEPGGFTTSVLGTKFDILTCAIGSTTLTKRITVSGANVLLPGLTGNGLLQTSSGTGQLIVSNALPKAAITSKASNANAILPILFYFPSVAVATGTDLNVDIAQLAIPDGITRYRLGTTQIAGISCGLKGETVPSTLAGCTFQIFNAALSGGIPPTGDPLTVTAAGPADATAYAPWAAATNNTAWTSRNLYINQSGTNANTGTVSFYLWILPCP